MKNIEDIEKLEWDQLESASLAEGISAPEGLQERIRLRLAAHAGLEEQLKPRTIQWAPYVAIAAAAAIAVVAVIPGSREKALQDTYDNPYLAYAQVEATFRTISDKMAVGARLAAKADETAEKTLEIINKVTE